MAKKKKKKKDKSRQKSERRRQHKRGEKNARQGRRSGAASPSGVAPAPRLPPLDPPDPERCFPTIFLDEDGQPIEDPHAVLGIERDASEEAINDAWRRKILEHPPERDPENARRLQEARERLLDPAREIERMIGAIQVPNPEAFGLPSADENETVEMLDPLHRALSQLVLYAMIEDYILADEEEQERGPAT